ncbi:hypothetical protein B0H67DRAFT_649061 [Lasiosphaeris hirsuta]|uniref:Uncharacterized protein n=1 Tax=Lasiosphaeris hirsuta TaxID=260670 RepID=A0AA40DKI0_9PEZI|nr:hypothetical protein B0H67DRAFT_649061 [Lasiosphaeris hirsuta]
MLVVREPDTLPGSPMPLPPFTDVICYVTRNQKAWADSALRLLEWSMVGAQSTINQQALPALIIILNGPTLENPAWISGDPEAAAKDFYY